MSDNSPKTIYDFFQKEIENKMKDKQISIDNNNQCYLIKDNNWINNFKNNYNRNNVRSKYIKRTTPSSISQNEKPDFLNDFESVIDYLKEKKIF